MRRADLLLAGIAAFSLAGVGAALVSQHVYDMMPCAWCVFQRLIYVLIAAVALLALLLRAPPLQRFGAGVLVLLALGGVAAAGWQHFVAAPTDSCDLSLAENVIAGLGLDARYPEVFMALATCADAAVDLLGVPYEFWSLALFVLLGAAAAALLRPR